MKTFLSKLKSSLLFSLALASLAAVAKPVAQVTELSGQVFVITSDGKTQSLKLKDHVEDKSEIMVGEDGVITLNDYYDATYHLISGSHLKFFDKSVQLKKGKTWIQSYNARHPLALTTANAHVNYWKSEFIVTFDQATARSQFLVVNGDAEVSNILDKNMKYTVSAGTFTTVDPEVENGLPRSPTKVGLNSLNQSLAEFKQLPEKLKTVATENPVRSIASVEESAPVKKGTIIFINSSGVQTDRLPASASGSAYDYYKNMKAKKKEVVNKQTPVPIRYFGVKMVTVAPAALINEQRMPASLKPQMPLVESRKITGDLNIDPDFSQSLKKETGEQPKFPKELENLIQDLKSY